MRKLVYLLGLSLLLGCEEVIDVELNEVPPKLVIEASINWIKGTAGNEQEVKLSLTSPFFDEGILPANNAIVSIVDSNGNSFSFIEEGTSGVYKTETFVPTLNESYTLIVLYEDEVYRAQETLLPVVPIDFIEQENNGGFSGEDVEIKAFYTDPAGIENYYFFEFRSDFSPIPDLEVYEDRFTDGNQIFGFYSNEDADTGNELRIRIHGASKRFYDFMFILLQQGGEDSGGPFETQPASVRGNCINETNPDNFPFGYFRLSEVDEVFYTVQ
jgi:hypothetical protein